jgi:hypothetical protein
MANFKKNDAVAVIGSWDDKGTVRIRRGIVHSAGAKIIRLQYEDGEMFKTAFNASRGNTNRFAIIADATDEELEAFALEMASRFLVDQRAHFEDRKVRYADSAGFVAAMVKNESELHEPRFMWK